MRQFWGRRVCALIALAAGALVITTGAAAEPGVSTTTPFTYGGFNSCTGEAFSGTGSLHTVMTENVSASGNLEFNWSVMLDGLKAETPLGKKYVVQDIFNLNFTFGKADQESFDIVAHYVRVGEDGTYILGDDFYEYLRTHITANANGMITAFDVSTNSMPCQ
jgi:hypothetical protein